MTECDNCMESLHTRILDTFNVDMPPHIVVNYAIRHSDVFDRMEGYNCPAEVLLNNFSGKELYDIVRGIDNEYAESPAVIQYIVGYLKETYPEQDNFALNAAYTSLVNILPRTIQQMNACDNYKLCYYISKQRSVDKGTDEDVSSALMHDPIKLEKVYIKLCDELEDKVPLDVAVHDAGKEVAVSNLQCNDINYDAEKAPITNFENSCGSDAVVRYIDNAKSTTYKKIDGIMNGVSKAISAASNASGNKPTAVYSTVTAEEIPPSQQRPITSNNKSATVTATAVDAQTQSSVNINTVLAYTNIIVICIDVLFIKNRGFSVRGFQHCLSLVACVISVPANKKDTIVLRLALTILGVLLCIMAIFM